MLDPRRTVKLWCAAGGDGSPVGSVRVRSPRLRGLPALLALRACDHLSLAVHPAMAARRNLLGPGAEGRPRVLVRVDEFPDAHSRDHPDRFGTPAFARFHDVLAEAGVPYLLAVLPRVARQYLDPDGPGGDGEQLAADEREMLTRLSADGVTLALHGHTHRTRDGNPRRHSALNGLAPDELDRRLDAAERTISSLVPASPIRVFVPPFNRFDANQWSVLARRYDVICGGPESVAAMGLQPAPVWIGEAVYLPSYAPAYGRAAAVAVTVERLAVARAAVWLPVTLHPAWEYDDGLTGLRRLARVLALFAAPWSEFLDAVEDAR